MLWSAVETAAANHDMSVNEYVIDSLKRNVASPIYEVDEAKMEDLSKLAVAEEIRLMREQLETMQHKLITVQNEISSEENNKV
tara:strand:- start:1031 stop:1279 length:249 start_codon:yes stop_codon:yes gene_type:complete